MEKIECSAAIQVLPQVQGQEVIRVVDKVIEHIKSVGLPYTVGPFETTVEGDFETVMELVKQCQLICIKEGAEQVMSYVKICYAPNTGVWSIDEKITKHKQ